MTTLNSKQQHSYSKFLQLARFLRKAKHIHSKLAPFHHEVITFLHHLETIPAQAAIKANKGMTLTTQKRETKKEIARKAAGICCRVTAFAITTSNTQLANNINLTFTDIYTTTDVLLKFRIASIVSAITPLLNDETFKLYGIKKEDLTSLTSQTKQFTGSIHSARFLNRDSDYASRTITATLSKIKETITQMERLLILFAETHPSFIEGFRQATAAKQKAANNHNAIEGTIKDNTTNQPIQNATITAQGKNKTALTNASSFYRLAGVKTGIHTITITAEGYATQVITVKMVRGKTIALPVTLEPKFVSLPQAAIA